jgi:TetR/AcrR family transcriptional regulator, transcriptional repressor for nem operon
VRGVQAAATASVERIGHWRLDGHWTSNVSKGARTREQVIERAAALFNQHGYHGVSISDVMEATGLEKGGIYRHFASKEELALAAFAFAIDKMRERFDAALADANTALERLEAILAVYARIPMDPPVPGGCPILNAAVEADDSNPELKAEAQRVLGDLKRRLRAIVRQGQEAGELRPDLDLEAFANVFVAQLEGGVMVSKLLGSQAPMRHVVEHLSSWLEGFALEA